MKIGLLNPQFLDREGVQFKVGGVETYMVQLAHACLDAGWQPRIFQPAAMNFETEYKRIPVQGVETDQSDNDPGTVLGEAASIWAKGEDHALIYCSDQLTPSEENAPNSVVIQHGIEWDLETTNVLGESPQDDEQLTSGKGLRQRIGRCLFPSRFDRWTDAIAKQAIARRRLRLFDHFRNVVCVDHNFVNWSRTVLERRPTCRIWVIPNATQLASPEQMKLRQSGMDEARIIFARRFRWFRGSRMMLDVSEQLLRKYSDLQITFAGEGPDEALLRERFADEPRVRVTKYQPDEALGVHLEHSIAIIPSLGSEGTTLAVAEAMSAGCAVVATNIGGITNMVLDGYNGLLVMPETDAVTNALMQVIEDVDLRKRLGRTGHVVAEQAFNLNNWGQRWLRILEEIART